MYVKLNEIDVSNLSEGMEVGNYAEMCRVLGESPTTSDSKIAQIKRWRQYFDFVQNGRKFTIKSIYSKPLEKNDARQNKNGVYMEQLEYLIVKYLEDRQHGVTTKANLCLWTGMANSAFYRFSPSCDPVFRNGTLILEKEEKERYEELIADIKEKYGKDVTESDIVTFYQKAHNRLYGIIGRAIRSLEKRGVIESKPAFVIIHDNGRTIAKGYDDKRVSKILKCKNGVLKRFNAKSLSDVIIRRKVHAFFRVFKQTVLKEHNADKTSNNWKSVCECFALSLKDGYESKLKSVVRLKLMKERRLDDDNKKAVVAENLEKCRKELNKLVAVSLDLSVIQPFLGKEDMTDEDERKYAAWRCLIDYLVKCEVVN